MNQVTAAEPQATTALLAPHLGEVTRLMRSAWVVIALGLVPALCWLAFAPLSSAVMAPAYVKVDLNRRPIQHAEGGIVREVRVRDGQHVEQGQTLLVLGDIGVEADASRLGYLVAAERVSMARLEAEEAMHDTMVLPDTVTSLAKADPRIAELLAKERALFSARRGSLVSQIRLLRAQRESVSAERVAMSAQITNATESLRNQRNELEVSRNLQTEGFISGARVSQLEATVADYGVKLEEKRADMARADQRATEIDLRIKTLENDYRQQASDQLKISATRFSEFEQEQRKSSDAASRQVISAPASGEIMNLKFTTPGTVVAARETIADIVPSEPTLLVEASIRPRDITRVWLDSPASIRFSAFKSGITPLVQGRVVYVSPDRLVDPATRNVSYNVLVEVDAESLANAGSLKLQAGMPAEVYITGEKRTPLIFLLEPITDLLRKSARET